MNSKYYYASKIVENAIDPGRPVKGGTFRSWQDAAIKSREALLKIRADYEKDIQELYGTYTTPVFLDKKARLDAEYAEVKGSIVNKLTEALDAVCDSKRARFSRCCEAPSAQDLRLLQALDMRSSLSVDEVAAVLPKLNGNVQSIAVLRDIAAKSDIHIPVGATTPAEFDAQLEKARAFSLDRLRGIDTVDKEQGYNDVAFYRHPDEPCEASYLYGLLDNNVLTSEQITASTNAVKQAQDATETPMTMTAEGEPIEMWAEVKVNGAQHVSTIAGQFHVSTQQVRDANPDMDLDNLHNGDKILVPSTRFSFVADGTGHHVQPGDVRAVPRPVHSVPVGPNGERVGADVTVV